MASDRDLQRIVGDSFARMLRDQIKPARIVDSSDLPYGKARVYRPDLRRQMIVNSLSQTVGLDVWLLLMPDNEYSVLSTNVAESVLTFGASTGSATLPQNALDFAALSVRDLAFEPGRLQLSKQGGTYLHVTGFDYNGGRYQPALGSDGNEDGTDDTDVAAYFPAGSGEYGIIGCYYDPNAGTLTYFAGEHAYDTGSFAFDDRESVPTGTIPIGAVLVTEGNDLTAANKPIFFSWHNFLSPNGHLLTGDAVTRMIASGVLTVGSESVVVVAAESGTADDLDTLDFGDSLPRMGWMVADTGDTITIKHGTDNISCFGAADVDITDADAAVWVYDGTTAFVAGGGGGGGAFTDLSDAPASYSGAGGKVVAVNSGETALELVETHPVASKARYIATKLYDATLGSADRFDVANAALSEGVYADYDRVEGYILDGASTVSATIDNVYIFLNGDTTVANYGNERLAAATATAAAARGDDPLFAYVTGATSTANYVGSVKFTLFNPGGAKFKNMVAENLVRQTATAHDLRINAVQWENTAAVTQITVQPDGYATDKFAAGTRLILIGYKAEAIGGIAYAEDAISATPTDAELDGIFGAPATLPTPFTAIVKDSGDASNQWVVWSDGSQWLGVQGAVLT